MSDSPWVRVTTRGSIPVREGRPVRILDRDLAIFNLGERFLAVENRCPHLGGPLADGIVTGCAVVCPLHAWKVQLDTGAVSRPAAGPRCVQTFPTRIDGDVVLVQLLQPADRGGDSEAFD
jgi:nitrite reductase (NADH) small subunit